MNSFEALARARAARNAGVTTLNVFDWKEAARIIADMKPKEVYAGLQGDWEWTGGCIWEDGKPNTEDYTYLQSMWAIPEIQLDDGMKLPCYKTVEATEVTWSPNEKWPEEK